MSFKNWALFLLLVVFSTQPIGCTKSDNSGDEETDSDTGADTDTDTGAACAGGWFDSTTNLCWEAPPSETQRTWSAAISYCDDLNLGGHTDWRLPTISELRSLIRGCAATMTGGACEVTDSCNSCWSDACYGCDSAVSPDSGCKWETALSGTCSWYWSSSSVANIEPSAWLVDFNVGFVYYSYLTKIYYARCVRGGP